jgi:hypothetical protein
MSAWGLAMHFKTTAGWLFHAYGKTKRGLPVPVFWALPLFFTVFLKRSQ